MSALPAETRIGHVHLKVSDLERSLAFWRGILGFEVQEMWIEGGNPQAVPNAPEARSHAGPEAAVPPARPRSSSAAASPPSGRVGAAFLSAGGYHHHVALNTWLSAGAAPAPARAPGLYHVAILLPDRASLARLVRRVLDAGWPLEGAADHGVSEAVYLSDPDGNGVELYRDRPRADWPRDGDGKLRMTTGPLDLGALLAEGEG